jgi:DNA polymerase III alpha subunit
MGLKVLSPDVNESFVEFSVVPGKQQVRFGMAAVKGVGVGAVEEILRAREEGPFKTVDDFAKRVSTSRVNRKAWESLTKAGAFDQLADRSDLLFNMDTVLAFASKLQKEAASGQADLFGGLMDEAVAVPGIRLETAPAKHSEKEHLLWERELLGLYLSSHPLDKYDAYFEEQTMPLSEVKPELDEKSVTVGGVITTVRSITTKNGSKMAFVGIEDKSGEGEVIAFPNLFEKVGPQLVQDQVVKVFGKVNARDRDGNATSEAKVIADDIVVVSDDELDNYRSTGKKMKAPKPRAQSVKATRKAAKAEKFTYSPIEDDASEVSAVEPALKASKLFVHVKDPHNHDMLSKLKQTFNGFPGMQEVILVLGADKKSAVRMPFTVEVNDELQSKVADLFGAECVAVK